MTSNRAIKAIPIETCYCKSDGPGRNLGTGSSRVSTRCHPADGTSLNLDQNNIKSSVVLRVVDAILVFYGASRCFIVDMTFEVE